jgi:deoxyhypusine synthase
MHLGNAQTSDVVLREEEVVRIYDIFFDYSVLLDTDAFFRKIIEAPEFQRPMSTASFTILCGVTFTNASRNSASRKSRCSVCLRVRSADLTLIAGRLFDRNERRRESAAGNKLAFDPSLDVNETAAIVLARNVAK